MAEKGLTIKEKAEFFNTLSVILRTGVSIPVVLEGHLKGTESPPYRRLIRRIVGGAKSGRALSEMMDPSFGFSRTDMNLLKSSERCGNLPEITKDLSNYYNQMYTFHARLRSALLTPVLLFSAAVFIASSPVLFSEGTMKYITDVVSTFLIVGAIFCVCALFFLFLQKRAEEDRTSAEIWMSIPFWGPIARNMDLYRFSRLFSLSISAGEGMSGSLMIAASGVYNCILKQDIYKAKYLIEKRGMTLQEAFVGSEYLKGIAMRIMAGGEISGTLDSMTSKLSVYTYEDVLHQVDMLVKKIRIG
jgi:type II secretory pathway component PulF